MRILIIEDERLIADSLAKGFKHESYAVDVAYTGTDGFDMAVAEDYDCIILDLMLPGMDGITICKKLREEENVVTPILMLTAKSELDDKVEGLNIGADDYLTKPFAFEELLARIRALTRRPKKFSGTTITVDDLSINTNNYNVVRSGKEIKLSKTEYALLEYLARNKNQSMSKEKIIEHVWNFDADVLPNTVEVYIGYLRNKIDKPFPQSKQLIQTVRGFGYKIGN
ncbi:MAG: Two component transcriptional regulator, winged helix family [Microgenomates group bacterium GW2011_GWC1_41_8]|uniref:Two component transcriptional regulator, winged helix family n=3 Tax=Candidatus Roizmaniibacteriota TaxID=1752723 RepID=A0A0G0ZL36_9BACT|nr:MAG: Two component transcriptional regulator, winged helix family [Candidatus Roizmanbacteria bacterium GW2011_GWB1_40_7]KKR94096.1 MAG: Two component transcriptional regulator, winged helix family [Candidatus Roizmanbacteria bacterium GW2011_GWA1_41_13]KKS22761.1 MAG: Two component transcriptional regulator, winged helix family [Candidatus Roizmanbacteria bacterium GW2011_GWC2_41_7]KKS23581.1 MAG: Two component transcriptional regulator, winged helix family [Microgenomates group bacterium GW